MGRLIDADKLLETLQDLEPHCENKDYEYGMLSTMRYYMPKIINDEPTAYDMDNVVEELLALNKNYNDGINLYEEVAEIPTEEAIEIVKQGGISDDVCEWKVFDNSLTDEPQWVYGTTCGKYVEEEHTSKVFTYCPYCGKKIKVVK